MMHYAPAPVQPALVARASRGFSTLFLPLIAIGCAHAADYTKIKSYLVPVTTDYVVQPLLSVGDQVPNTSDRTKIYQMIGIPDGLGAHRANGGRTVLYMNHELGNTVMSEPNVGGALNRGAFVSRFILDREGRVLSGERAYDFVHDEETKTVLAAPQANNTTRGFGRFCSGSLAWREAGFDRPIFISGEESGGAATFDGKGGLAVAIFDHELHTLVKMGRFAWENTLVRPDDGEWTVAMCMEDGPTTPDNQLYLYVGRKNRSPGASVLSRNGLDTGKLYAFVSTTPGKTSELNFTTGSITGKWVELPDQTSRTEAQLEADSDAVGAFGFIRIEDGAWSKTDKNTFYFVTTGNGTGNKLGRVYEVKFNPANILGTTTIKTIYNNDTVAAIGGDMAFAPDNIDTSKDYLMLQEDGTSDSRPEYAKRAREGSIWRLDLKNNFAAKRVAEMNPNGAVAPAGGVPPVVGPGVWETSGIIDATDFFGADSWLTVVQAHGPSLAPAPNTVEDGQLLLMLPARAKIRSDDDRNDDRDDRQ
ncbi:MAG: DUF839 domain-containing protein [Opitutaceae bacterium]|nr:DUF839 domain-containing protein [Opitutaceae bacterium]